MAYIKRKFREKIRALRLKNDRLKKFYVHAEIRNTQNGMLSHFLKNLLDKKTTPMVHFRARLFNVQDKIICRILKELWYINVSKLVTRAIRH